MGQDGNIVQFKIKKATALKKLMSTYCERAGLAMQTIRFSFDGQRLNTDDTPKALDMEDGRPVTAWQVLILCSQEILSRCSSSSLEGAAAGRTEQEFRMQEERNAVVEPSRRIRHLKIFFVIVQSHT